MLHAWVDDKYRKFLLAHLNESYPLGYVGSDGRIILKCVLMKWDKGGGIIEVPKTWASSMWF